MAGGKISEATIFVIFGGEGDLTGRKLGPALYSLFLDGRLPERFKILGVGRKRSNDESYRAHLREENDRFSIRGKTDQKKWDDFASHISFFLADLDDPQAFAEISKNLSACDEEWGEKANRIYYLALPPHMIKPMAEGLAGAGLNRDRRRDRIVVEKPFGHDLNSARELNRLLAQFFDECQIYRIDHYLGKETVQNILAFRFGNTLFEPIWNRRYIDHVQITVAEKDGVGHRAGFYEHAGALRDIIQNHVLQILCLIAMEAPVSFESNEIRQKKVDVLRAIRTIYPEQVLKSAVRGQYGAGWIEGERVSGYRSEPGVAADSHTETFAAVKLYVDNWRWQDVPFYMRTGKRLPARISEVSIHFRPVPHQTFHASALLDSRPNRLLIAIQPEEGILLRFEVKHPGQRMALAPVMMQFYYREAFSVRSPDAYETLLLDIMEGDSTLFMRADQTETAWAVLSPILEMWESVSPTDFPNYQAGSWGPEAADIFIAQDGRSWAMPTFLQCREDLAICRVAKEAPA
ncbi:MAG TPA: glucose-6-phosphate dehydrogenase [Syntrophobacteraceae bacterium]|nr:glucose-6-phosphate dehydrogenase [Syntrophobacteraceae bacterium]